MTGRLAAYLNKVTMGTKKGAELCAVEFAATLATGTLAQLEADDKQLAALPTAMAQACRRMIADRTVTQMALEAANMPGLAVFEGEERRLEWKRTVLLERVRVKKEEDKDYQARARILFLVNLDGKDGWPGRNLVGKWVGLEAPKAGGPISDIGDPKLTGPPRPPGDGAMREPGEE
ncbi:MAG: hypothetical protein ACRD3I_14585 [Terriglobales bacterium]